jgi:hypothetical protein
MWPELPVMMQANRAFLRRAIRYAVGHGVTQFLDIGSDIPTVGNSHEVARQSDPACRVVAQQGGSLPAQAARFRDFLTNQQH